MAKETAHSAQDAQLLDPGQSAFSLALYLGCLASFLLVVITWLALVGAMSAGWLPWEGWLFVAAPIAGWILLLAGPALVKARRGALATLDAIAGTAEAYLARAGWSIDLNNDGYVGHYRPQINPPQVETHQPRLYTVNGQAKLLAHQAALAVQDAETQPEQPAEPPAPPRLVVKLWELPNGAKVEQAILEDFSDRLSTRGWSRKDWVKRGGLDRAQYDGLMALMDTAGIITGRGKGSAGQLAVKRPADRRQVLGLVEPPQAQPKPTTQDNQAGRYEHIPGVG